jgi:hypothetical protein
MSRPPRVLLWNACAANSGRRHGKSQPRSKGMRRPLAQALNETDMLITSRVSPAMPSAMNRACQVHTTGFNLPERRMISRSGR